MHRNVHKYNSRPASTAAFMNDEETQRLISPSSSDKMLAPLILILILIFVLLRIILVSEEEEMLHPSLVRVRKWCTGVHRQHEERSNAERMRRCSTRGRALHEAREAWKVVRLKIRQCSKKNTCWITHVYWWGLTELLIGIDWLVHSRSERISTSWNCSVVYQQQEKRNTIWLLQGLLKRACNITLTSRRRSEDLVAPCPKIK